MHEILQVLDNRARILDLGGRSGSLPDGELLARAVILDIERPQVSPRYAFVQGDAAALPFRDGAFQSIVANHSMEHIDELDGALREVGRVAAPGAYLFASVPDSTTLSDKLYRWLGRGGGHVNPFPDPETFAARVAAATGLPQRGYRLLHSGYSFVNRKTFISRGPRRLWLIGGGFEPLVRWGSLLARLLDRRLGTRLSVYGWAFYFGAPLAIDPQVWSNVCIRCGSAASAENAEASSTGLLRLRRFRCARCGTENFFTDD